MEIEKYVNKIVKYRHSDNHYYRVLSYNTESVTFLDFNVNTTEITKETILHSEFIEENDVFYTFKEALKREPKIVNLFTPDEIVKLRLNKLI